MEHNSWQESWKAVRAAGGGCGCGIYTALLKGQRKVKSGGL